MYKGSKQCDPLRQSINLPVEILGGGVGEKRDPALIIEAVVLVGLFLVTAQARRTPLRKLLERSPHPAYHHAICNVQSSLADVV